jgi:predicted MFS family arabinose efflux permease
VFLVFGALGIFAYLGHLAYEVFKDSVLFPFALVLLGLGVIVATVLGQKYFRSLSDR